MKIYTIKRNPLISIWFVIVLFYFWYRVFGNEILRVSTEATLLSLAFLLILLLVPFLYLIQRVEMYDEYFIYKGLFSRVKVNYGQVKHIGLEVTSSKREGDQTEHFHSMVFQLYGQLKVKIPFVFLGAGVKGKPLINEISEVNPKVELDENVQKIKDGQRIISLEIAQILTFIFANGLIFLIMNLTS